MNAHWGLLVVDQVHANPKGSFHLMRDDFSVTGTFASREEADAASRAMTFNARRYAVPAWIER